MDQPIIIVASLVSLTLVAVIVLLTLYLAKEKKKAQALEGYLQEIKNLLKGLNTNIGTSSRQQVEKIHNLDTEVRAIGHQVHAELEQARAENSEGRNETKNKLDEITASLTAAFEKKTDGVKAQISNDLEQILNEIKAPLELD